MSASVVKVAMATLRKNDPVMGQRCNRCRHERVLHVGTVDGTRCWTQEDDGWWCECTDYQTPTPPEP